MSFPFVDLGLARRLERAEGAAGCRFVEVRAGLDPAGGACWQEMDGALAIFDGAGSPLTQTFALGLDAPLEAPTLRALERFFADRGAAAEHEVCPLTQGDALGTLTAAGYEPFELTSVMYRPVAAPLDATPAGDVTVRLAAAGEADAWAEVAADGWSEMPEVVPFVRAIGGVYARMPTARCYLAHLDGQAAAAGVLVVDDGVALLGGASTRPRWRRRGAQLALLAARLDAARQLDCDLAMMSARPGSDSQRNAERHGFRIAYTRIKWRRRRL